MNCIYEKCRYLLHLGVKKLLQTNKQTNKQTDKQTGIYTSRFSFKTRLKN